MPELFIINEEWTPQFWVSTGGTRAKRYLESPDGRYYYFKRSQYKDATATKPGKDFTYEFWSEVIASEVGQLLGFNVLRYDIAVYGDLMGCISKSMIKPDGEEMVEGVRYLQGFSREYNPDDKSHRAMYTFQLIELALKAAKLEGDIEHIVELIVFDALIGNGDRHQENWAFINHQVPLLDVIEKVERQPAFADTPWWQQIVLRLYKRLLKWTHAQYKTGHKPLPKTLYHISKRPAPIYDNGSSLGRELTEERVRTMLASDTALFQYIDRGLAEIHWNNEKLTHFALIRQLLDSKYEETVTKVINRVNLRWNGLKIASLLESVDAEVPETHAQYRLPKARKELIFRIISLRRQRLVNLLHA